MPRVTFVKAARKDNPVAKKGQSYFWWKFRYGGKRYSLTRPRQSQLTQSAYFSTIYSMQEQIEDATLIEWDDASALIDEIKGEIENLRDETQGSLDNMPEALQYSPTGELLQERIDALENAESELDSIDEWDEDEPQEHEYTSDCDDCEGTGQVAEDEDKPDDLTECETCSGSGTIEDEDEFTNEHQDWEQRRQECIEQAAEAMDEALSNCIL